MKFVITWAKLKYKYAVVNAPNKTIAYNQAAKFRNDVIINNYNDPIFTVNDFENFNEYGDPTISKCNIVDYPNTFKTYGVQSTDWEGPMHHYCHPEDLEKELKKHYHKDGYIISVGRDKWFARKVAGKPNPLMLIKEVKNDENVKLLK